MNNVIFSQLLRWAVAGFIVGLLTTLSFHRPLVAQLPTAPAALPPQSDALGLAFESDAGIMLKFVRPEKVPDFEATVARVKEALERTRDRQRQQQAVGWKVFKAIETATNGDVVYVVEIDPAIKGADYRISRILTEAFPAESQSLYRRYSESYSTDQHIMNLTLIATFGGALR
jgi:hypothetical protein